MKPKVLIDSISLLSPLTGIGRYTYEVSKQLKKKNSLEINFFYGYHSKKLLGSSDKSDIKILKSIITKNELVKKLARKVLLLSSKYYTPVYDVYWQPNFIPNEGIKAKKIVTTVHDFSFILHKDFHPKERIEFFENNFYKNIYKSDMIITGSEFSKKEILDRLDYDEDKIKVIYHGLNHDLFKVYNEISLEFKLPEKFIFSVGSIEPRKNLIGLLKAYDMIDEKLKKEYKLVLAGFKGWKNNEIMELINKNKDNIIYLGFISDIELAKVYNLSSQFVFPSFYEGFGLPVLEAMACGTPVVCSNKSSIPEVGADAVVYCDPYCVEDIKDKITLVLDNKILQNEMRQKGLDRAKNFSWDKSSDEHIKVFKEVMK